MATNEQYARPDYREVLMRHAELAALRSTCPTAQVGAVLARGDVLISSSYNGAPRGVPHCTDAGCVVIPAVIGESWDENVLGESVLDDTWLKSREYSRHVHAEANLIAHCARQGIACSGADVYVTRRICLDCLKLLASAGIYSVVMRWSEYIALHPDVQAFAAVCGVTLRHMPDRDDDATD